MSMTKPIAEQVRYTPSGAGAVETTALSKLREFVSVKDFGAVGDGSTNDAAALQLALNSTATSIYFPAGDYVIVDSNLDGTAVLTSTVHNRTFWGPGRITCLTPVYKALEVSGNRNDIHLTFAGNNQMMVALVVTGDDCEVSGSKFLDLYAPASVYQAIGVRADFDGVDYSIRVVGNTFRNIEAVGDGTGGNGVGLSRAITIGSDQALTKTSIIANNTIDSVIGEEGDSIAIIASDGLGVYYDLPVLITGNAITTWTRRSVKVQSNKATVQGNTFRNTYTSAPSGIQHAVSLVQGGDHVVDGNVFVNCRYAGQVVLNAGGALERVDNITVTNNVVLDIGAETTSVPFFIQSYGENVTVAGNKVLCPNLASTTIITVANALSGFVSGNYIKTATTSPYAFTGSTNLLLDIDSNNQTTWGKRTLSDSGDAFGINVFGSTNRSLTLYNWDTVLSDAEIISRIQFHQNDVSAPNAVHASIRAVAVGSTGSTALAFHTGGVGTADLERLRISTAGIITPGADNTQTMGSTTLRWSYVHAFNVRTHGVTVAGLPTAATAGAGARAFVTDANATTFASIVAGGGANGVPVYSDGTNWRIG